jgi:hypothetical protein
VKDTDILTVYFARLIKSKWIDLQLKKLVSIEILRPAQQAPAAQMQILAPWHVAQQHPQAGQAQELALDK